TIKSAVLAPTDKSAENAGRLIIRMKFTRSIIAAVLLASIVGCESKNNDRVQGYVEGDFVYVASPLAGQLLELNVDRGNQVKAGDPLFSLEDTFEKAARDEAVRRVTQSKSNLEDAKKGKRPTEIDSLEAQLKQATAALAYSTSEAKRMEDLAPTG